MKKDSEIIVGGQRSEGSPERTTPFTQESAQIVALAKEIGLTPDDLCEPVYDAASEHASKINNHGLEEQIGYLIECFGPKGARSIIEDCRHEPLSKGIRDTESLNNNADRDTLCADGLNGQGGHDGRWPPKEEGGADGVAQSEPPPPSSPDRAATTTQGA